MTENVESSSSLLGEDFQIIGRMTNASNSTLVALINGQQAIYKPVSGERPLWDFPEETLALRERAAYVASELLGWHIVPETILRDGPEGFGSVQRWIDGDDLVADIFSPVDVPHDWRKIIGGTDEEGQPVVLAHSSRPDLARIAVFDALINNADRKAGHIIISIDDVLFGIDHGVTFNHEDKLRTVLWGWIGEEIDAALLADIQTFSTNIDESELTDLLNADEIEALKVRAEQLVTQREFPEPSPHWPSVPWPVF